MLFLLACSGNFTSSPNTSLTVDYYGIRENTIGLGWNNPLDVERLLLGSSRPLVVIFADPELDDSSKLVGQIIFMGWKEKVWVIDSNATTSKLVQTLMNGGSFSPTLVYMNKNDLTMRIEGKKNIVNFLTEYSPVLGNIKDGLYYD